MRLMLGLTLALTLGLMVRAIVRDVEWAGNEIMRYLLIDYRASSSVAGVAAETPAGRAQDGSGKTGEAR